MSLKVQRMNEEREVRESYAEGLARLTFNDKIVISHLTEVAKENSGHAQLIVGLIEDRLRKVKDDMLLPHLYLIDSICKNLGSPYTVLFQHNLVSNFVFVFSKVHEKVRSLMFKLRHTWTQYNIFTQARLTQLDKKVQGIDPNWPIVQKDAVSQPKPSKILINPAKFPQQKEQKPQLEDETERMRAELLRKEKELLEMKRREIDMQLAGMHNQISMKNGGGSQSSATNQHQQQQQQHLAKISAKKEDSSRSAGMENRDPRIRDPRKRRTEQQQPTGGSSSSAPSGPGGHQPSVISNIFDEPTSSALSTVSSVESNSRDKKSSPNKDKKSSSSGRDKKSGSSTNGSNSSSRHSSSSRKSSKSDSNRSSSTSGKSSSSSGRRAKEEKTESTKEAQLTVPTGGQSKRSREPSPAFSSDNDVQLTSSSASGGGGETGPVGRISPLRPPPAHQRIPKLRKGEEVGPAGGRKRTGEPTRASPPPDKRPKPVEIDLVEEEEEELGKASPAVGWAKHKESNPDQYRTPVKEMGPFFSDQHHQDGPWEGGAGGGWGGNRGGGPFRGFRGRGFRRERGHPGGRGGGRWQDDRSRPFVQSQGRGGGGLPGPYGRGGEAGGPPGPFNPFMDTCFPGLPGLDLQETDPEVVRKEVIPKLIFLGQQGRQSGGISEEQFREFMSKVMILKESSLIREAERRQERKENRMRGGGPGYGRGMGPHMRGGPMGRGGGGGVGGPPDRMDIDNNHRHRNIGEPLSMFELDAQRQPGISPHKNDLPMADPADLKEISSDPTKSLKIDDMPRFIRYYGETATIVMEDDLICHLSFQPETDSRRVIIDDSIVVYCTVGSNKYSEFVINGNTHKIKIGSPTRELWIDNSWHECYFNTKISVKFGGLMHNVFLEGPAPSVKIGDARPDLCKGRVFLLLDGNVVNKLPLYLDRKPQLLEISGKLHVLRFVEGYKTLTINGHPFRTDFGGFPMVISVGGRKHYLRLTALPETVSVAVFGRDRKISSQESRGRNNTASPNREPGSRRSPQLGGGGSPLEDDDEEQEYHPQDQLDQILSVMPAAEGQNQPPSTPGTYYNTKEHVSPSIRSEPPPLQHSTPTTSSSSNTTTNIPIIPSIFTSPPPPIQPPPDINDLWAKLQSSGVFSLFGATTQGAGGGTGNTASGGGGIPGLDRPASPKTEPAPPPPVAPPPASLLMPGPAPIASSTPTNTPSTTTNSSSSSSFNTKLKRNTIQLKEITLASHHPSLKERQQGVIDQLFGMSDLQCKSCGLRFSPEDMSVYSSHLDWHFRAKRRERDNARKAQSRRWYYEKNDWIVSDEIEDDEQELTEEEIILEQSVEIPTIPVNTETGGEETCPVCLELFNQVYKQGDGEEEGCWHLHNAMRDPTGLAYHPECFKDKVKQEQEEDVSMSEDKDSSHLQATGSVSGANEEGPAEKDDGGVTSVVLKMDLDDGDRNTEDAKIEKTEPMEVDVEPELAAAGEGAAVAVKQEKVGDDVNVETTDQTSEVLDRKEADVGVKEVEQEVKTEVKQEVNPGEGVKSESAEVEDVKEDGSAEDSVNVTGESGNTSLMGEETQGHAPVVLPQQKVDIKVSITSNMSLERRESMLSQSEDSEESEFDPEAIVVPARPQEEREAAKPKLKGRRLTVMPPQAKDSDLSGLCSIM